MKKSKTDQLIEENAAMQKLLTPENTKYYDTVLLKVRLRPWANEQVVEETLSSILQDILEAQADGVTAREFIGKDANEFADEVALEIPQDFRGNLGFFLGIALMLIWLNIMANASTIPFKLDVGQLIMAPIWTFMGIGALFYAIRHEKSENQTKVLAGIIIAGLIALVFIIKTPWILILNNANTIILILVVMVLGLITWFFLHGGMGTLLALTEFFGLLGLLTRWSVTASIMNHPLIPKGTNVFSVWWFDVLLSLFVIGGAAVIWWWLKKINN